MYEKNPSFKRKNWIWLLRNRNIVEPSRFALFTFTLIDMSFLFCEYIDQNLCLEPSYFSVFMNSYFVLVNPVPVLFEFG